MTQKPVKTIKGKQAPKQIKQGVNATNEQIAGDYCTILNGN